jgi:predicted SnoaL-like aldol condensation-catalyzing enzyme
MFSDVYVYPQGAPVISESDEEAERKMVVSAYLDIDNNQNLQTIEAAIDPRYLQHNPHTASGLPAFIAHVQSLLPNVLGPRLTILHTLADADLVFTIRNGGNNSIAADIWRVVDGKIVEHWDVNPPPPAQ